MTSRAVSEYSVVELENLVANYRRLQRTHDPLFHELLQELELRKRTGLDFNKSMALIRKAANERRYLPYKSLADESGAEWAKVHYSVGRHLSDLVEFAHLKGWPLLSAIVVNAKHVETGDMDDASLDGFVKIARELGYAVTDKKAFLREQQERVFQWAAIEPNSA